MINFIIFVIWMGIFAGMGKARYHRHRSDWWPTGRKRTVELPGQMVETEQEWKHIRSKKPITEWRRVQYSRRRIENV